MESWLQALGATALIFHGAAVVVWLSLFKKLDRVVWTPIAIGYIALVTHRVNELLGGSVIFAQFTANVIAYVALYAVLQARSHLKKRQEIIFKLEKFVSEKPDSIATHLAERIVELKNTVARLRAAPQLGIVDEKPSAVAVQLAEHFASARDAFDGISAQLQMYREVADTVPLPIVVTDLSGALVYANPAYLEMLNTSLSEVLGDGWKNQADPESIDEVMKHWKHCVDEKQRIIKGSIVFKVGASTHACRYRMVRTTTGYCGCVLPGYPWTSDWF